MNDNLPLAAREMRQATARLYGEDAAATIFECAEIGLRFAEQRRAFGIEWPVATPEPMLPRLPPPHSEPLQDRAAFTRQFNNALSIAGMFRGEG